MLDRLFHIKKQRASTDGAFLDSERLRQANEALYKQGAELATRNKTLSLLDRLNTIATHGDEVGPTAQKLAQEMVGTFEAPYSAILFYEKSDKSLSLVGYAEKQARDISFARGVRVTDQKYPGFNALRTSESLVVEPNGTITGIFFPQQNRKKYLQEIGVVGTFIYPLSTERGPMGLLIIGLNRPPAQLSAFERDGIASAVNVVAVAIDKTAAYTELKEANVKLKELDKQKTEFLDIASHQLRTPLSALIGLLSMQYDGDFDSLSKDEKREQQKNMLVSAERLKDIVRDFMDAMEVEVGLKLKLEPTDAAKLVEEAINTLRPNYEKKKLYLKYTPPKSLPIINSDPAFLSQIFINLIDNACQYTETGGAEIDLLREKNDIVFKIKDTGIGVMPAEKEQLFGKFARAKRAMLVRPDGSGLGLFIVKKIVEAHGGAVELASAGENKGTTFSVYLPINANQK